MIQGSWFILEWNLFFIDKDSFFLLRADFFRFLKCVSCFGNRAGTAVKTQTRPEAQTLHSW